MRLTESLVRPPFRRNFERHRDESGSPLLFFLRGAVLHLGQRVSEQGRGSSRERRRRGATPWRPRAARLAAASAGSFWEYLLLRMALTLNFRLQLHPSFFWRNGAECAARATLAAPGTRTGTAPWPLTWRSSREKIVEENVRTGGARGRGPPPPDRRATAVLTAVVQRACVAQPGCAHSSRRPLRPPRRRCAAAPEERPPRGPGRARRGGWGAGACFPENPKTQ